MMKSSNSRFRSAAVVIPFLICISVVGSVAHAACTPLEELLGCTDSPATAPPAIPVNPGGSSDPVVIPGHIGAGKAFGYSSTGLADNEMSKAAGLLHSTGAAWLRLTMPWKGEQVRGTDPLVFARTALNGAATELGSNRLIVVLLGAPYWAHQRCANFLDLNCLLSRTSDGQWGHHTPPGNAYLGDYARAALQIAADYPGAVIETWNEPNLGVFWSPDQISPERMAGMQCSVYDAIKAQHPTTRVSGPGLAFILGNDLNNINIKARSMDWRDFTRRMYVAMGRICWDIYSVHPYVNSSDLERDDGLFAQFYADLRAMRNEHGDESEVFITEFGWPTGGTASISESQQQDLILRQAAKHLEQPEVGGVFVHTLHEAPYGGSTTDRKVFFGVFRLNDSPKPTACALGNLITGVAPSGC